jgi:two-component system, sensor histidine kinase and response regulator
MGSLDHSEIERGIAEITATKNYARRLAEPTDPAFGGIAQAINLLLDEVESREKLLRIRLADLADARDDAQTSTALLRRAKDELSARSVQLDAALQKAAAASSAKSSFLANMSHEIRTPMNGILGMAELLNRSPLNPRQKSQVGTIVNSGRALLTIINDILDFSKIESGKYELAPTPFDLRVCLSDIVELLSPTAGRKSVAVALDYAEDVPRHLIGDAGRIRQVVMNLAGNAVKFTDKGSVRLKVSGQEQDGKAALRIDIIDTGIGIPAEMIAQVFEKFSMVDQTGTRRHEGTGLGLSICQLLAHRMDGSITASSELGKGSTFSFSLVLELCKKSVIALDHSVSTRGKAIALIGSEADVETVQTAVSDQDWNLIFAGTAADLDAQHIDVAVFVAQSVPDTLAHQIAAVRKLFAGTPVPAVVVVKHGTQGDALAVSAAGAQAYLSGDINGSSLADMIHHVLPSSDDSKSRPLVTRHVIAEAQAARSEHSAPAANVQAAAKARRARVLIVDDSMVNQEIAREFLEDLDCDIETANNGQQAVDVTGAEPFDLILMDCQMPIMDGFAATAAIRQRDTAPTLPGVPIIALTANAFASDKEKCLASGMSDFLSKPFLPGEFDAVVQKWLSGSGAAP